MIRTIIRNFKKSGVGIGVRDRFMCFCLATYSGLGENRRCLRRWFTWLINRFPGTERTVTLRLLITGKPTTFRFRRDNRADYLIVGEMIRGEEHDFPAAAPDTIIDAGANIGSFLIVAARRFPNATIICYEPNQDNFAMLAANAKDNGIQAELKCMGVWSHDCSLYFHPAESYNGHLSELPSALPPVRCELPSCDGNTFIKMDAEGAEYAVLPELFRQGRRVLQISLELHNRTQHGNHLVDLARESGYEVYGPVDSHADCVNLTLLKATHECSKTD